MEMFCDSSSSSSSNVCVSKTGERFKKRRRSSDRSGWGPARPGRVGRLEHESVEKQVHRQAHTHRAQAGQGAVLVISRPLLVLLHVDHLGRRLLLLVGMLLRLVVLLGWRLLVVLRGWLLLVRVSHGVYRAAWMETVVNRAAKQTLCTP